MKGIMSIKPELLRLMDTIEKVDEQTNDIWTAAEELHNKIVTTKLELAKIIDGIKE